MNTRLWIWAAGMIAIIGVLLMPSCGLPTTPDDRKPDTGIQRSILYVHDERTNLCFAIVGSVSYGGYTQNSMTLVPCSPEVLAVAGK